MCVGSRGGAQCPRLEGACSGRWKGSIQPRPLRPFPGGRGLEQNLYKRLESPAQGFVLSPRVDTSYACTWPSGHRVSSREGAETPSLGSSLRPSWQGLMLGPPSHQLAAGTAGVSRRCPAVCPSLLIFLQARSFLRLGHTALQAKRLGTDLVARTRFLPGQ